jgi:alpha-galactosidase
MIKIAFIGAGSTVFARNLIGDILSFPELSRARLALHDIDADRLHTTGRVARQIATALDAQPTIQMTTERRAALDGADYALSMFQVAGYEPGTLIDFEVPKKYGLRQTIADTLGIGGIMRGLRTIPVLLDMCRDMETLCPEVIHLHYVNPMAINCWAINRASSIRTIGLCHSVQGTANELARDLGLPAEEIDFLCAGINHMAFYLRFGRRTENGFQDLYPRLHQIVAEGRVPDWNRVRYEILAKLGYFVTESSEHFAEYVPWFIKRDRPDLIERFHIPLDEYLHRCQLQIAAWDLAREMLADPASLSPDSLQARVEQADVVPAVKAHLLRDLQNLGQVILSGEYAARIIHSMETGAPRVIYGNVPNRGLIENLPDGCIVEVPCLVDANGVQPTQIGSLPPHLAALMQTNINVQALTVEAALTRNRAHIYHAAMLDPHTAAELDLDQIWGLVDDLIEAHGDWLPAFH